MRVYIMILVTTVCLEHPLGHALLTMRKTAYIYGTAHNDYNVLLCNLNTLTNTLTLNYVFSISV